MARSAKKTEGQSKGAVKKTAQKASVKKAGKTIERIKKQILSQSVPLIIESAVHQTKAIKKPVCQLPGADLLEEGKSVQEVMAELAEQKRGRGRPKKYNTPEEMQEVIDAYFESCWQEIEITKGEGENRTVTMVKKQVRPYTMAGLALALGYVSRQSIYDNEMRDDEFSYVIKKARLTVEMFFEENMAGNSSAGSIFWLKNHAGYKDRTETGHTFDNNLNLVVTFGDD